MVDYTTVKLGRQPPRHDSRKLMLADYVDAAALPPIPDAYDAAAGIAQFDMDGNNIAGCCVEAAWAHGWQIMSTAAGVPFAPTAQQVLAFYGLLTGYPASDNGTDPEVMFKALRATGWLGNQISAYAGVDWRNTQLTRAAIKLFGGLSTGFALPLALQDDLTRGARVWDVPAGGATGRGAAGSWGGHEVWTSAYLSASTGGFRIISWGDVFSVTPAFLAAYCFQLDAVLDSAWFSGSKSVSGFDAATLADDLLIVSGQKPNPQPADPRLAFAAWLVSAAQWVQAQLTPNPRGAAAELRTLATETVRWERTFDGAASTGAVSVVPAIVHPVTARRLYA